MERGRGQTRPDERRAAGAAFLGQAGALELLMVTRLRLTFTFPRTQVKKTSSSGVLDPPSSKTSKRQGHFLLFDLNIVGTTTTVSLLLILTEQLT